MTISRDTFSSCIVFIPFSLTQTGFNLMSYDMMIVYRVELMYVHLLCDFWGWCTYVLATLIASVIMHVPHISVCLLLCPLVWRDKLLDTTGVCLSLLQKHKNATPEIILVSHPVHVRGRSTTQTFWLSYYAK